MSEPRTIGLHALSTELWLVAAERRDAIANMKAANASGKRKWPLEDIKAREDRLPTIEIAARFIQKLDAERDRLPPIFSQLLGEAAT